MHPQVSIIMATYNRSEYILESLRSIQQQTFEDWECLIIDDGSTDDTQEVLTAILNQDTRFKYFKRITNYQKGLPGSRNYGLDLARGDYIIFFDDDDIVHPQNLELCVFELLRSEVSFCRYLRVSFYDTFDYKFDYSKVYDTFKIDKRHVFQLLNQELPFNSCAVLWKKDCFKEDRYVEHLLHAEEWELYSRILSTGITGVSIEKVLFFARRHSNSMTGRYFRTDPKRTQSNIDAIVLVIENLKKRNQLNYAIVRYFIAMSYGYREYDLFGDLIKVLEYKGISELFWKSFFFVLPLRLKLTRIKKRLKKMYS
ncbi:glycosyltransferase family 2 protein [Flavobacterium degerlachei]|jgi:glycosyltransferase involved in cell wall biosynthesis|uniref:Glycosyltransferase involved in cell wall bisynthesis n=1 Tax=Flavobacterium degerlachei TaxID=229203 RepID=A0A1H2VV48_9FLAO|nr:glycosyltransferase family 2 protein [Flavobacterium degerlachei]SDW72210.1 Glycosyltransferase involved in cell wall bisynthesis [Flavobacterium degerlachei]